MENSIKEDIERLKLCSTNQCNICGRYEKEECMLERNRCEQHILLDYKRVLKENEELNNRCRNLDKEAQGYLEELAGDDTLSTRTMKQLQKENEDLKEEREIVGIPVRNKRDGKIGIVLHQWKNGSVAVLESINPRVINTHDSWNTLEIVTDEVKQTQTKCETISVSLIKDKIEQVKEKEESDFRSYGFAVETHLALQVLQELLEEKGE